MAAVSLTPRVTAWKPSLELSAVLKASHSLLYLQLEISTLGLGLLGLCEQLAVKF